MIPVPSMFPIGSKRRRLLNQSTHSRLAVGRSDMRKGMNGLALQVQQALGRDPHAGDLYVFRGARGDRPT